MKTPRLHVQFPISGRTVRLKIAEAIVHEGDCIEFWLEDGRNFRMAGEGMAALAATLPILETITLPKTPPWHPSPQ